MKMPSCSRPRSPYEFEITRQIKEILSNEFKFSNERQREILQFMIDDIDLEEKRKTMPDAFAQLEKDVQTCKVFMTTIIFAFFIYALYALYALNHAK